METIPQMKAISLLVLCSGTVGSWTGVSLSAVLGINVEEARSTFGFAFTAVAAAAATLACDSAIAAVVFLLSCTVSLSMRMSRSFTPSFFNLAKTTKTMNKKKATGKKRNNVLGSFVP